MKRFHTGSLGVAQGSRVMFSDFAHGGVMWTGEGDRESRHIVRFKEPFRVPPMVHVGITMWDIDHKTTARADLTAEHVTETSFDLVFKT